MDGNEPKLKERQVGVRLKEDDLTGLAKVKTFLKARSDSAVFVQLLSAASTKTPEELTEFLYPTKGTSLAKPQIVDDPGLKVSGILVAQNQRIVEQNTRIISLLEDLVKKP